MKNGAMNRTQHQDLIQRPSGPVMNSGHAACPGCGVAMSMRLVLETIGKKAVGVVVPSCAAIICGPYPNTSVNIPLFHSAFEVAAVSAAGISNALKVQGVEDTPVVAFAGDGGTFDIGLQSLSGAADRNEDFLYICLDNEGYMNTGVQVSSATPKFSWTGTTPTGNTRRKKQIMEIMAAHRIPYAATATPAFPQDLAAKVKKALSLKGTRFIHLLSPCNTGWKIGEADSPKTSRLAVETSIFPLYEIEDGIKYTINYRPKSRPVADYLSAQGRYRHLAGEHIKAVQAEVDRFWADLEYRSAKID